jgi:hypothetical protein
MSTSAPGTGTPAAEPRADSLRTRRHAQRHRAERFGAGLSHDHSEHRQPRGARCRAARGRPAGTECRRGTAAVGGADGGRRCRIRAAGPARGRRRQPGRPVPGPRPRCAARRALRPGRAGAGVGRAGGARPHREPPRLPGGAGDPERRAPRQRAAGPDRPVTLHHALHGAADGGPGGGRLRPDPGGQPPGPRAAGVARHSLAPVFSGPSRTRGRPRRRRLGVPSRPRKPFRGPLGGAFLRRRRQPLPGGPAYRPPARGGTDPAALHLRHRGPDRGHPPAQRPGARLRRLGAQRGTLSRTRRLQPRLGLLAGLGPDLHLRLPGLCRHHRLHRRGIPHRSRALRAHRARRRPRPLAGAHPACTYEPRSRQRPTELPHPHPRRAHPLDREHGRALLPAAYAAPRGARGAAPQRPIPGASRGSAAETGHPTVAGYPRAA